MDFVAVVPGLCRDFADIYMPSMLIDKTMDECTLLVRTSRCLGTCCSTSCCVPLRYVRDSSGLEMHVLRVYMCILSDSSVLTQKQS